MSCGFVAGKSLLLQIVTFFASSKAVSLNFDMLLSVSFKSYRNKYFKIWNCLKIGIFCGFVVGRSLLLQTVRFYSSSKVVSWNFDILLIVLLNGHRNKSFKFRRH